MFRRLVAEEAADVLHFSWWWLCWLWLAWVWVVLLLPPVQAGVLRLTLQHSTNFRCVLCHAHAPIWYFARLGAHST